MLSILLLCINLSCPHFHLKMTTAVYLKIVIAVSYTHSTLALETNSLDEICISLVYILDSI